MYANKIALNQQQIEMWNWQNLQRPATGLVDLTEAADAQGGETLASLLEMYQPPREARYDKNGAPYGADFYSELQRRAHSALAAEHAEPRCGVVIDNSLLRAFPTMAGSYREGEEGELDRFAVALLKLGEPVLVYGTDESGVWCFARSAQAGGWMLAEYLAWEPDEARWRQYCSDRAQLLVADSRRLLEYIDADGCARKQQLLMGTRLALYDADRRNFVAGLPVKDRRGNLAVTQLSLPRDGGFVPGTLPFSAQNVIGQAKKALGEPYGWGGTGCYRDCTSLMADVFSLFGLRLPLGSNQQLAMCGVEPLPSSREQKYQYISELPPGSVLYFPGHAMLYLGRSGYQLQILHSVYAIGLPSAEKIIPYRLRRVVEGNLQQRRANGELFLDAVTACWPPERLPGSLRAGAGV